jgi:hypothetical protein
MAPIDMSATYRRREEISKRAVGASTYLIDPRHNTIHQLNTIGSALWEQLAEPQRAVDLIDLLHAAFGVRRGVIEGDVRNLMDELLAAELIVRVP